MHIFLYFTNAKNLAHTCVLKLIYLKTGFVSSILQTGVMRLRFYLLIFFFVNFIKREILIEKGYALFFKYLSLLFKKLIFKKSLKNITNCKKVSIE